MVFTGGDDSKCCVWDLRDGCKKPLNTIRHSMGVCSVQNYSDVEHFISTGSYDETLYIWDLRMIHSSKDFVSIPLHSCHFGGGVWRHKWGPHNCVIVSAMHGGFAVAHLPQSSFSCQDKAVKDSVYKFRRTNGQLAYGIDWGLFHGINEKEDFFKSTVVSCSFYDNTIEFGELSVHI
ncbi:Diphthine methyltransferase [Schistosoma japonicum]|nr:Diphthine methyltransferase [Schistosoma japonicum]KAH8877721.1 Diphthine methyltransferase [Schistosoma japonicum]KAH8877722.1 Diphthine methyltransferase [Schistosoma japonicum]